MYTVNAMYELNVELGKEAASQVQQTAGYFSGLQSSDNEQ
jgi:hypothetical protein